ncbi:MAG: hypothetical protein AAGG48_21055, partial [Planctomycetota bacterium]
SNRARLSDHQWERNHRRRKSGWMSPIEIDERRDPSGPNPSHDERRASWKGFLSISLSAYLQLVDWTGRQFRRDRSGSIPTHLEPILKRLGINSVNWCGLIQHFDSKFKRAVGNKQHLAQEAARRGQKWLQSPGKIDLSSG